MPRPPVHSLAARPPDIPLADGELLVATEIRRSGLPDSRCSAAPLLAASLERADLTVRRAPVTVLPRRAEGTLPLAAAWREDSEARRFAQRGDTVVLIGHAGHEEIEGTLGEAPGSMILVANADEAATVDVPDTARLSRLTQTTLSSPASDSTSSHTSR